MGSGIAFGMGYLGYGFVILLCLAALYMLLSRMDFFEHKSMSEDRLLRITIPESLEYSGTFDEAFAHYLKKVENAGVKTTGMGSMFRLSFKIQMKDPTEEKAFIDELRTKNGNLEIAIHRNPSARRRVSAAARRGFPFSWRQGDMSRFSHAPRYRIYSEQYAQYSVASTAAMLP